MLELGDGGCMSSPQHCYVCSNIRRPLWTSESNRRQRDWYKHFTFYLLRVVGEEERVNILLRDGAELHQCLPYRTLSIMPHAPRTLCGRRASKEKETVKMTICGYLGFGHDGHDRNDEMSAKRYTMPVWASEPALSILNRSRVTRPLGLAIVKRHSAQTSQDVSSVSMLLPTCNF